jgi:bifunctional enzyme CysN/CysC
MAVPARNLVWHDSDMPRDERWERLGLHGAVVWLTGLSGSGKSTIAAALERLLVDRGTPVARLDGDNIRHGLCSDLGFGAADRDENIRRVGEVAVLMADAGLVALVPVISPYREGRDRARGTASAAGIRFVEVHVDTPISECERRDPKGLYAKARAGELRGFTGIDAPYEAPEEPELRLRPEDGTPEEQAAKVAALLDDTRR